MKMKNRVQQFGWVRTGLMYGLTGLVIVLVSGCVSSGKFDGMVKERDMALAENTQMEEELNNIVFERDNLIAREVLQPRETVDVLPAVGAEPRGSVGCLTRHKSSPSLRGPVEERFTPEFVKRWTLFRHPDRSSRAASRVEGRGERDIAGSFSRTFEFGA